MSLYEYADSVGKPIVETNLYSYTGNDPVNWIDPLGLLKRDHRFWENVKEGVMNNLKKKYAKFKKENPCEEAPPIAGEDLESSLDKFAEAFADELTEKEFGFLGRGVEKNSDAVKERLKIKYPDWPWEEWDIIFK